MRTTLDAVSYTLPAGAMAAVFMFEVCLNQPEGHYGYVAVRNTSANLAGADDITITPYNAPMPHADAPAGIVNNSTKASMQWVLPTTTNDAGYAMTNADLCFIITAGITTETFHVLPFEYVYFVGTKSGNDRTGTVSFVPTLYTA